MIIFNTVIYIFNKILSLLKFKLKWILYFLITFQSVDLPLAQTTKDTATFKLTSWNIRDLGRSKDDAEIAQISKILNSSDIIVIQEIVGKDPAGIRAVAKIVDKLNRKGSRWDYIVSNPTKSSSSHISERYGFIWKTNKVKLKGRPSLDLKLEEACQREPFVGHFLLKGHRAPIKVVNFHATTNADFVNSEVKRLSYYKNHIESEGIFVCGDFNISQKSTVWNWYKNKGYHQSLKNKNTTLHKKCFGSEYKYQDYDNIIYTSPIKLLKAEVIDYVQSCENLQVAYGISDHLPVSVTFAIEN